MFGTFILGVIAGWAAPYVEPRVKEAMSKLLPDEAPLESKELAYVTLSVCLLVASLLAMIISTAYAFPLVLGLAVGVVGPRLISMWRAAKTPDYDS